MGLRTDERLGGITLYLYTPEQHAQNLASIAAYRQKLEEYSAQIEALDQKRRDAQQRRAPPDELNAITQERNRTRRPDSQFVRSVFLYNVVHFGDDYIELTRAENPNGSTLIPLSRICKVIVTPSDDPEQDEQSDARKTSASSTLELKSTPRSP